MMKVATRHGPSTRRLTGGAFFLFLLVLGLATIVYWPGTAGPFLLDDQTNIPQTSISDLNATAIAQPFLSGERLLGASRGITRISFALTQYFSDGSPFWFKYQNLILHLLNGLLVFWLIYLLARQPGLKPSNSAGPGLSPAWIALAITALWLLHPLHVSTVLYAVQRLVLLASLFMLAALICYVKGRTLARTRPVAGAVLVLIGVGLFGLLGLLSKEIAALMPLLIGLIEWFFFGLRFDSARERTAIRIVLLLVVVVPMVAGVLALIPQLQGWWGWHPSRGFSGAERLMTQAHVLAFYLKLFFIPIPGTMSLFHDNFPISHALDGTTLLLIAGYMAAVVGAIALRDRAPWIGFGILWFLTCHLLESTRIPLELVFEHRNYLAILGLCIGLVGASAWVLSRLHARRIGPDLLAAVLVILSFNTAVRAKDWSDMG
ncbi:MAG: hypothetical protein WBG92_10415, partial [Thiohalocapsa sp.]